MKAAFFNALLVGAGGFIGALLRYGLGGVVQGRMPLATFPYGTLAVNLLGCLLIGIFAGLMDARQIFSPEVRVFALIGVLGGFTTYSTFGFETFAMLRDADYLHAALNVGTHVVFGLGLIWAGYGFSISRWA